MGVTLAALAVGGNVFVYSSLDDSTQVVQFTSNVPAGDLIAPDDVRIVEVDADLTATDLVTADQVASIVGQYARTFIPARSLASAVLVSATPIVSAGQAVVAITPAGGRVPRGLTERSRVWLVTDAGTPDTAFAPVEARIVAIDDDAGVVLSVEVAEADAPAVAAAADVHVVLLDPGLDPVHDPGSNVGAVSSSEPADRLASEASEEAGG